MISLTPVFGVLVPGSAQLLAQDDGQLFLGEDFLPWIVLALGAAMVAGNVLALLRPPEARGTTDAGADAPTRPPLSRAVVMIVIGLIAAIWGIASLIA
jgi:hypothetical protein